MVNEYKNHGFKEWTDTIFALKQLPRFKGKGLTEILHTLISEALAGKRIKDDFLISDIGLVEFIPDVRHMDFTNLIYRATTVYLYTPTPETFFNIHEHLSVFEHSKRLDTMIVLDDSSACPPSLEKYLVRRNRPFETFQLMIDDILFTGASPVHIRGTTYGFKYREIGSPDSVALFTKQDFMRIRADWDKPPKAPQNTQQK